MKRFIVFVALLQICSDCYSSLLKQNSTPQISSTDNFFIISGEHIINTSLRFGGWRKNLWLEKNVKIKFVEYGEFILQDPWTIVDVRSHSVFGTCFGNTEEDLSKILDNDEVNKIPYRNSVDLFQEDRRCIKIPPKVTINIKANDIARSMLLLWVEKGGRAIFTGNINFFKLKKFILINEDTHTALTSFEEVLETGLRKIFAELR